ncbi:EAL domain-containing protein [Actinoplanes sp. NPDC049596]|uniref:EAL domain-containing protein n=1 Tax=unclassified Actinoplanes TaxID=2626549 RepID=UPI00342E3A7C
MHAIGNGVASDDVGADPASLAFLPLIEPDVVKLDMHLVRDPYSAHTQATADAVAVYAERSGAIVLAEGMEEPEDAVNAAALGAMRPGLAVRPAGSAVDRADRSP